MSHQIHDLRMNDFIDMIFDTFLELRGDRRSGDDKNVIGGLVRLNGYKVVLIGYQRDEAVETPKAPGPQGYRKCSRLIRLAEAFNKPVIVFIDFPEAFSLPALNQQQANEALARNLEEMSGLMTPIICVVTGECNEVSVVDICAADRVVTMGGVNRSLSGEASRCVAGSEFPCLKDQNLMGSDIVHRIANDSDDLDSTVNAMREIILEGLNQLAQIHPEVLVQQRLHRLQHQFSGFGTSRLSSGNSGEIFEN